MRTKAWPHRIHEAQCSQLNKLSLPTKIVPLGVCGLIITESRKKHHLGGRNACLGVCSNLGPQDLGRLEVHVNESHPTNEAPRQERKHHLIPRSNLYIPNHNAQSYEKRKGT